MQLNAMIFAAGLGSRLRPLTDSLPKALVPVGGKPLLEIALCKMERLGIQKVVVNVHHHAGQILDFLKSYRSSTMQVLVSDERDGLLDTGGGVRKALPLFDKELPLLLYNVDVLTHADLSEFVQFHCEQHNSVTLMVQTREASRYLLFDEQMRLGGWRHGSTGREQLVKPANTLTAFGFQGIHMLNPNVFSMLNKEGNNPFSLTRFYLKIAEHHRVSGYRAPIVQWFDIGTPEKLERARNYVEENGLEGFL